MNNKYSDEEKEAAVRLVSSGYTVREVASVCKLSKSYIWLLCRNNIEAKKSLAYNKSVRHLRGGEATSYKYQKLREAKAQKSL